MPAKLPPVGGADPDVEIGLGVPGQMGEARIAAAQDVIAGIATRQRYIDGAAGFSAESFSIARRLLRAGDERPKPNGERLSEYADARRESFELSLFTDKPIYPDYEIITLADSLTTLAAALGANDPTVIAVLAGKSPRARAAELINTTKVRDVAFRKKLYEGGAAAVAAPIPRKTRESRRYPVTGKQPTSTNPSAARLAVFGVRRGIPPRSAGDIAGFNGNF
eukprot:gene42662-52922_t